MKLLDTVEEAGQYAFYAVAGTALFVGTCWAVGCVIAHKSFKMIKKKIKGDIG